MSRTKILPTKGEKVFCFGCIYIVESLNGHGGVNAHVYGNKKKKSILALWNILPYPFKLTLKEKRQIKKWYS
jgi:hypothetical protein